MLRFSGVGSAGIPKIIELIESGLEGPDAPGTVGYFMAGTEYMIRETRHNIPYHSSRYSDLTSPEEVVAENESKPRYLARKFVECLEDAGKIWVIRHVVSNNLNELL